MFISSLFLFQAVPKYENMSTLRGEGYFLKSQRPNLPAHARKRICAHGRQIAPKLQYVARDQHLAHRMGDLSLAEGKALDAE